MVGRGGGGSSKVVTAGSTPMISSSKVYLIMMHADFISVILAMCLYAHLHEYSPWNTVPFPNELLLACTVQ